MRRMSHSVTLEFASSLVENLRLLLEKDEVVAASGLDSEAVESMKKNAVWVISHMKVITKAAVLEEDRADRLEFLHRLEGHVWGE